MSEVRVNNLTNANQTGGPTLSGITTFSSAHFFVPPQGDTASRPSGSPVGALRFNTDTYHLEYYRGDTIGWVEREAELTEPLGGGTGSNTGLGHRGLIAGGYTGSDIGNHINFMTISTLGNAQDFGDLVTGVYRHAACGSRVRGFFIGGSTPSSPNGQTAIDTSIFASTGNATDYGDLTQGGQYNEAVNNSTRAVVHLGSIGGTGQKNVLEYFTMSSTGSGVDFGDLNGIHFTGTEHASPIRGFFSGGQNSPASPYYSNTISAITISTLGTYQDWGDYAKAKSNSSAGFANANRALLAGGYDQPYTGVGNSIDYFSTSTSGNALDFGDTTVTAGFEFLVGLNDPTRGIIACGSGNPGSGYVYNNNFIEFVTISSTGNAQDFGDLAQGGTYARGCSSGNGGL